MKALVVSFAVIVFLVVATKVHANHEADITCFNIFLFSNFTIAQCNSMYSQYLNETDASTFCSSNCPQPLAQAYQDCGYTSTANQIATECAQDDTSRYCGDMLRDQNFNNNIQTLMTNCNGINNCSGDCQTAIENVGCCANIAPNVTESGAPIDMCNLQGCSPIPINKPSVNPQSCFSSTVAEDSVLQQCYQEFLSAAVMAMGNPDPTRTFCSGNNCPRLLARTYATCGLSAHSILVQRGCSLDESERYCGNVVDSLITPQWTELVASATTSCAATDCTNADCQAVIDNLGCCIALGVEVGGAQLPLAQCNVEYCPATFDLTDEATVIYPLSTMIMSALAIAYSAL